MNETSTTAKQECRVCETPLKPGEHRIPTPDGPQHYHCDLREKLENRYRFYINNPQEVQNIGFSLWKTTENGEQPVIQNTGGLTVFQSFSTEVGDSIIPSEDFFDAIIISHNWLMCLMAGVNNDEIDDQIEIVYGEGQVPDHERWAIHTLVGHLHPPGCIIPELADLREYVDQCTGWGTPKVMGETNTPKTMEETDG